MGFENPFKRKQMTPQEEAEHKKQVAGTAAGLASAGALAGVIAAGVGHVDGAQFNTSTPEAPTTGHEHVMPAHEQQAMMPAGPGGVRITANPESGVATIHLPEQKPVSIDYRPGHNAAYTPVEMRPPEPGEPGQPAQ